MTSAAKEANTWYIIFPPQQQLRERKKLAQGLIRCKWATQHKIRSTEETKRTWQCKTTASFAPAEDEEGNSSARSTVHTSKTSSLLAQTTRPQVTAATIAAKFLKLLQKIRNSKCAANSPPKEIPDQKSDENEAQKHSYNFHKTNFRRKNLTNKQYWYQELMTTSKNTTSEAKILPESKWYNTRSRLPETTQNFRSKNLTSKQYWYQESMTTSKNATSESKILPASKWCNTRSRLPETQQFQKPKAYQQATISRLDHVLRKHNFKSKNKPKKKKKQQ